MRYLGRYDVLAVAARVLRCASDDAVRRSDLDAIDRVLDDVRSTSILAEAAGVLLAGLVRARPFDGANRVVAVAVVLQFVALNGAELQLEPVEDVDELLDKIADGEAGHQLAASFIRSRLEHRPVTAEDLQEHFQIELMLQQEVLTFGIEQEWWRGIQMYERFSEQARQVIVLAQEEARGLDHVYIGTEHLLLGVITLGTGVAARVLTDLGITAPAVRDLIVEIIGRGQSGAAAGSIPFTPRAKSTFEFAWSEAKERGADQVAPEHLLLGVLHDGDGVGGQIITKLAEDVDRVRRKLDQRMDWRRRSESVVAEVVAEEQSASWTTYGRRHHLIAELNAVLDENERLHEQVASLRELLRRHGINPDS
ncbi:Clp protease N-terminal domain-containing protein [Kribbella shirazensis]|uniref:Prophage maintenance system killer protein n=1 Tax=Kribbella shirazensis TaxID=1105143 RepID=A0A7X6A460_9ACTN|nr:Clp protease N-terminal domain-containing protein [Kribbella shirazensis]NIK59944.1 prophage maintenance system killer protein [Kribbella shirazensis]